MGALREEPGVIFDGLYAFRSTRPAWPQRRGKNPTPGKYAHSERRTTASPVATRKTVKTKDRTIEAAFQRRFARRNFPIRAADSDSDMDHLRFVGRAFLSLYRLFRPCYIGRSSCGAHPQRTSPAAELRGAVLSTLTGMRRALTIRTVAQTTLAMLTTATLLHMAMTIPNSWSCG